MSIRTKMILFISAIMLAGVTVISYIWYRDTKALMDTYLNQTAGDLMQNAYHAFQYILTDTDYMLSMIALNEENIAEPLKIIGEETSENRSQMTYRQLQNKRKIDEYIGSMYGYKYYITGISVVSKDGIEFKVGRTEQDREVLEEFLENMDGGKMQHMVMLPPVAADLARGKSLGEFVVPAVRCIGDGKGGLLGYAVMYFDYSVIEKMFSDSLPAKSIFRVTDEEGNIIFANDMDEKLQDTGAAAVDESNYVYSSYYAQQVGWNFWMAIPADAILDEIKQTFRHTGILFALIYLVLVISGIFFVYRITEKLQRLRNAMMRVAGGELEVVSGISGPDEIGRMGSTFDDMVIRIRRLLDTISKEEKKKREVEMDFLQAQINPHFISNTLNVIAWMAKPYGANNIIHLTNSLTSLLRSVMRKGGQLISVDEELLHVKSYIDIVSYSGSYDFTVDYQIEEGIRNYQTIRFILQPIVENAIQHGIGGNLEEEGQLRIGIFQSEGKLCMEVEDNGCGMTQQQLKLILSGNIRPGNTLNRIGIQNVQERIQLIFGEQYGITYRSEEGQYTKAIISLPLIGKGKEDAYGQRTD